MKLRYAHLFGAALVALLLASCQIVVEPGPPWPPANAIDISLDTDANAQQPRSLGTNQAAVYRLGNPGGGPGVIYVELDNGPTAVDLEVINAGGQRLFSSSSRFRFGSGLTGLGAAATADLDAQAIVTSINCRGACVLIPASQFNTNLFAKVTNRSGSTQSVGVFYFRDDFRDTGEPDNDFTDAPFLDSSEDFGAIETVGDQDYFNVLEPGNVTFGYINPNPDNLPIRAEIRDATQALVATLQPGQSFQLVAGDRIRVVAANPAMAGVSASSGYRLSYPTTLLGADVVPRSTAP